MLCSPGGVPRRARLIPPPGAPCAGKHHHTMRFSTQRGANAAEIFDEQQDAHWHSAAGKSAREAERAAAIRRAEELGAGFDGWVSDVNGLLARNPEPTAKALAEARALHSAGGGMWRLEGSAAQKHAGIMPALKAYLDACQALEWAKPSSKTRTIAGRRPAQAQADTPEQMAATAKILAKLRGKEC